MYCFVHCFFLGVPFLHIITTFWILFLFPKALRAMIPCGYPATLFISIFNPVPSRMRLSGVGDPFLYVNHEDPHVLIQAEINLDYTAII
jgi:hypothetical protein